MGKLTCRNLSRLLLEYEVLCWTGVPVLWADWGVRVLGVVDWAWTDRRADLFNRFSLVSASGTWVALPSYNTNTQRNRFSHYN